MASFEGEKWEETTGEGRVREAFQHPSVQGTQLAVGYCSQVQNTNNKNITGVTLEL